MNVRMMRLIDRFAGVPMALAIGTGLKLFNLSKPQSDPVQNVLVIKFFGMGSIALSTPALSLLRSAHPNCRITYLSFDKNREILERISLIDEIITIKTDSIELFLKSTLQLLSHLRTVRFDVAIDLEFFSKFSSLVAALSFAPVRAGFRLPTLWRRLLLTHQTPITKNKHVREAFCDVVRSITGNTAAVPAFLPLSIYDADRISLDKKLTGSTSPLIIINPNAGDTFLERRWPVQRVAETMKSLLNSSDATMVLIGVESERGLCEKIIQMIGTNSRILNLVGALTTGELLTLIERADLMLTNDSGPGHLAAILGCRVVSLFGPESPQFYGPVGDSVTVLYKGISCSPCMNVYAAKTFECPYDARCMKEIGVQDVLTAIDQSLGVPN